VDARDKAVLGLRQSAEVLQVGEVIAQDLDAWMLYEEGNFFFLPGTLLRGECFGRATERNRGSGTAADQAMGQRKVGKMESISSEGLETAQTRVHVSARVLLLIQVKNPLSFFVSDETHGAG
jgi:hypothetical protein